MSFEIFEDDKKRGDSGIILNIWLTETASGRLVSSRITSRKDVYIIVPIIKRTSSFKIIRDERHFSISRNVDFFQIQIQIREFFISW